MFVAVGPFRPADGVLGMADGEAKVRKRARLMTLGHHPLVLGFGEGLRHQSGGREMQPRIQEAKDGVSLLLDILVAAKVLHR